MLQQIDTLREIASCCRAGGRLEVRHSRWLGDALEKFFEHQCPSSDEALGLRSGRGGVPWWLEEAMRKRDAALRQLVANSCPARSLSDHARDVARLACHYAASAWRFDREKNEIPKEYAGTPKAYLWQAFKLECGCNLGQ